MQGSIYDFVYPFVLNAPFLYPLKKNQETTARSILSSITLVKILLN